MTQTLSPEATAHLAAETAEAEELARDEALFALAARDYPAYLATLTNEQLRFRSKIARICGEHWDADRFDSELARRTA